MTKKQRKRILTFFKVLISVALIYFIFTKINFKEVLTTLKASNVYYLLVALLFFIGSKLFASFRLNLFFWQIKVQLTHRSNLKFYLLGMFYNLFLPGGIGGDAYKGYLIQKEFKVGAKKIASVLILDRLSGMLLLFILACILALRIDNNYIYNFRWLILLAIPLSILTFWLLNKRFFKNTLAIFWKSLAYSFFVQTMQLVSIWFILKALGIQIATVAYLFIFLISSIVAVLPITIGGFGSREITFLYGAELLQLNEKISVSLSLTFFFITAAVSLLGIYYHFKKPKLEVVS